MQLIGRTDRIDIPEFGLTDIPAKIDTGANRSALHCSHIKKIKKDGEEMIVFHIPLDSSHGKNTFTTSSFFRKKIKSSSGHAEMRYIIKTEVVIFGRRIKTTFSLSDRTEMQYPILLGRKILNKKFVVDVSKKDLSYEQKSVK